MPTSKLICSVKEWGSCTVQWFSYSVIYIYIYWKKWKISMIQLPWQHEVLTCPSAPKTAQKVRWTLGPALFRPCCMGSLAATAGTRKWRLGQAFRSMEFLFLRSPKKTGIKLHLHQWQSRQIRTIVGIRWQMCNCIRYKSWMVDQLPDRFVQYSGSISCRARPVEEASGALWAAPKNPGRILLFGSIMMIYLGYGLRSTSLYQQLFSHILTIFCTF